jgi:hypothetical protein
MDTRDNFSLNRKQDNLSDCVTLFDTLFEVRPPDFLERQRRRRDRTGRH